VVLSHYEVGWKDGDADLQVARSYDDRDVADGCSRGARGVEKHGTRRQEGKYCSTDDER
jgi:hypothetical protein